VIVQPGGNGGKSIEAGNGGRSPPDGGLSVPDELAGDEPWLPVGAAAGGLDCGSVRDPDVPAPDGVAVVRPSEAATDDDPMPGTVGSIKLARPPDEPRGLDPEVRLTSVVPGCPAPVVGEAEPAPEPLCERNGRTAAGVCGATELGRGPSGPAGPG
jgi:hypothetical protein